MAKPKWPISKVVEISWFDANARGGWSSREDYMMHSIAPVLTVGYLFKQTDKEVMVVGTQGADFDDVNGAIAIPLSWIVKMKVLRK